MIKRSLELHETTLLSSKMYFSILKFSVIIVLLIYSHICHRLPIATPCHILLWDFPALAFALMSWSGDVKTV